MELEIQTADQIDQPRTAWFLYGPMGCIAGDVRVPYVIADRDGRKQNGKGGTMERLFYRFNGKRIPGKGSYQRPQTRESQFFVPSMDEDRRVSLREIGAVVESGVKPCVRVVTVGGRTVRCTPDHRFATDLGYRPIAELGVGARVLIHTGRAWSSDGAAAVRTQRAQCYVKSHPYAPEKVVRDPARGYANTYYRLPRARAVMEATLNGLTLEAYLTRLNDSELEGLRFLTPELDVHHRDENPLNDAPENLVVLSHAEHARQHGLERSNLRYLAEEDVVALIEPCGDLMTYDVQMKSAPFSFVAGDGFVVHNSGKTTASSTFPSPLFLVPASEGSELTLAQFKDRKVPFIRIGKRPDGTVVPARAHLSEILGELEKRHAAMFRGDAAAFPWETIVLESLTHFGDMLVEDVSDNGRKKMDQQGWGLISTFLRTVHSRLRNLDVHVVYTSLAKTQENEGGGIAAGGPALIGSMAEKMPSACDVVAYMEELPGQGKDARPSYRTFFRKYRWWQARARFAGFPDFLDDFDFAKLAPMIGASSTKG